MRLAVQAAPCKNAEKNPQKDQRSARASVHPRSAYAPKSHNADRSTLYTSADQLHPAGTLRCNETSTERPTLTRIPEAGVVCHT